MGTLERWEETRGDGAISCFADREQFRSFVEFTTAAVVQIRAIPVASMIDDGLRSAVRALPFPVSCAVASPEAVSGDIPLAALGEVLLFEQGRLRGRIAVGATSERLRRLFAGEDPPTTAPDDRDPFSVLGVSPAATFAQVRAAWRRRLAEYHPDRFAGAGEKIRTLALAETQRVNVAFQALTAARARSGSYLPLP